MRSAPEVSIVLLKVEVAVALRVSKRRAKKKRRNKKKESPFCKSHSCREREAGLLCVHACRGQTRRLETTASGRSRRAGYTLLGALLYHQGALRFLFFPSVLCFLVPTTKSHARGRSPNGGYMTWSTSLRMCIISYATTEVKFLNRYTRSRNHLCGIRGWEVSSICMASGHPRPM